MECKQSLANHTSCVYAPGVPAAFGADFSSTFFADWLKFAGVQAATHVRFAPPVVNGDVEGTRKTAAVEPSEAAFGFAGKLSAAGTLQLVNGQAWSPPGQSVVPCNGPHALTAFADAFGFR